MSQSPLLPCDRMDKLFGLPAHPLFVHIPIVLLPLAALGVIVMAIKPAWHQRYRWAVLALGTAGTIGVVLAAQAGEQLGKRVNDVQGAKAASIWRHHRNLGETARNFGLLFFVLLAAFVLLPWWMERRAAQTTSGQTTRASTSAPATNGPRDRWLRIAVTALAIAGAAVSVVTITQAGHSGSDTVWKDYVRSTNGG